MEFTHHLEPFFLALLSLFTLLHKIKHIVVKSLGLKHSWLVNICVLFLFCWYFQWSGGVCRSFSGNAPLCTDPEASRLAYSVCSLTPVSACVVNIAESFCYIWYLLLLISSISAACINLRLEVRNGPSRSTGGNVVHQPANHTAEGSTVVLMTWNTEDACFWRQRAPDKGQIHFRL